MCSLSAVATGSLCRTTPLGWHSGRWATTTTPHGFRAMASTILNEQGFSPDAIERQLCHMPKDKVRAAYNRAGYLPERVKMMQAWADYLDGLKNGAQVIPFKKAA